MIKPHLKSEKKYRKIAKEIEMILDYIPGLVFYKDKKNNFIRVNKVIADAHKVTKEAMEGKSLFNFYPKDQAQAYWDDDLEVINSGIPKLNIEEPWETEEGIRWRSTNKIPYVDDNGKVIGIIGFSVDITERKNVEQKLRKSLEQLDTIFTSLKDAIFVISDNYKFLFSNEPAHNFFGEDIIGKDCYKIIKGFEQPCDRCPMKKFAESDECMIRFEQCINTPFIEGTKYFDIISSPIENYDGSKAILLVLRDNTKHVKDEAEIRKLSAYNRNLIETSLDPLVTIGQDGKITDVNRAAGVITGRSREELIGTEFSSYFTEPEKASKGYQKVFEIGSVQDYELEIKHTDGYVTPVLYNASTIKDEVGNVMGVFAAARDITEQKKAEHELKESEEHLRILNVELEKKVEERTRVLQKEIEKSQMYLDIAGVIMIVINVDETIALVNKKGSEILGFNEKELIGKNWFDNFVPNRIRVEIKSVFKKVLAGEVEPVEYYEHPILMKNGEERLIAWHIVILRDNHGINIGILCSGEDITKRKWEEEEKIKAQMYLKNSLSSSIDGIVLLDKDTRFNFVNPAFLNWIGCKAEDFIGKTVLDAPTYMTPETTKIIAERIQERVVTGEPIVGIDVEFIDKNGKFMPVSYSATGIRDEKGNVLGEIVSIRDITERKRSEQEMQRTLGKLKESEEKYRLITENANDLIVVLNSKFEFEYINENTYQRILGYKNKDMLGKTLQDIIHPDDYKSAIEILKDGFNKGEGRGELRLRTKDGNYIWVETIGKVFKDSENRLKAITISRDITERKRSELEMQRTLGKLKESEEKYRLITENANDLIVVLNSKFEHEYINENTYQRILGYNNKDMLGKTRQDIIHPEDYKSAIEILKDGFNKGEGRGELRLRTKDGNYIWVETIGKVFKDSENRLKAITISRDISERKKNIQKLENVVRELKRSNEELEQFAYVASHDLQEPLRMVVSFTQLLQNRYQDKLDDDANEFITYAVDGATRMQNLINDLLMFSRVGTRGKPLKTTDMNVVLEAVISIFRLAIEETNTTFTCDPLPVIIADQSQMIQLLQNLISNAIKFRSEEPLHIQVSGEVRTNEWVFSVSDNGIGIDPKYFRRIFVIFHRLHRKGDYSGTGIGLAVCKKIIQRHEGKIWVESEIGKGSTFYFSIPK